MLHNQFPLHLIALICISVAAGCSSSSTVNRNVSLHSWQSEFDKYIIEQTNGDLSFLRHSEPHSAYPTFAIFSNPSPDKSNDAVGVFLGRISMDQTNWLVFLLGMTRQQQMQEIRIAMRSDEPGRNAWVIGENDTRALQWYRQYHESQSRRRRGESQRETLTLRFPAENDVFDMRVSGQMVEVRHEKSGAIWKLSGTQQHSNEAAHRRTAIVTNPR